MKALFRYGIAALICAASATLSAAVRPALIFSDNMVLQSGMPVAVWGKADPGETVEISFADQKVSVKAGTDGRWEARLKPLEVSAEGRSLVIGTKVIRNVVVGEVWLCAGQSNMNMPVWGPDPLYRQASGDRIAAKTDLPLLRLVNTDLTLSPIPETDVYCPWHIAKGTEIHPFSAAGFFFGVALQKALKVPVGLINSSWSGTSMETWTNAEGYRTVPELNGLATQIDARNPGSPEYGKLMEKTAAEYSSWLEKFKAAEAKKEFPPPPPEYPKSLIVKDRHPLTPGVLYNAMIHPYVPLTMRGVVWYQGEDNLNDPLFTEKLHALYNGWSLAFQNPALKFYIVQIAPFNYGKGKDFFLPNTWLMQQEFADEEKNAGMVVITDAGNIGNIHPADKRPVGKRLAMLALNRDYGRREIKADYPRFDSFRIEGSRVVLTFKNVERWTVTKGHSPRHFEIAGINGEFFPADAVIEGKKIVISSKRVANPKFFRYMWSGLYECNLANEAGLVPCAFFENAVK